jgi:hypothetical protein
MSNNVASFILRHVSGPYGFPCQTTFYVNDDGTVEVRTIMNDMGSDGMWDTTFSGCMSLEEARTKWRTLKAIRWQP